jgi:hypothetical protein
VLSARVTVLEARRSASKPIGASCARKSRC